MKHRRPRGVVLPSSFGDDPGGNHPMVIVLHTVEADGMKLFPRWLKTILDIQQLSVHAGVSRFGKRSFMLNGNTVGRHAPPNHGKIGIEQEGYARFSRKKWLLRGVQLHSTALLIAWYSYRWGIPIVHSTAHGVCQHKDLPAGGHSDCGFGYPERLVLAWARTYRKTVYRGVYK